MNKTGKILTPNQSHGMIFRGNLPKTIDAELNNNKNSAGPFFILRGFLLSFPGMGFILRVNL